MPICEFHLNQNTVLEKMTSFTAIVPDNKPGPFPVLYLLHGLSDDHTAWTRRTSLERYVDGLPLIVVMPNGERSFYTDAQANPKAAFETYIVQDLVGFVDRTFRTVSTREGRVIAGLSMGGYGAVKLALKHPDLFCAAVSHSGAVGFGRRSFDPGSEWAAVMGEHPGGGPNDIFRLVATIDRSALPTLRIDCGVDDFLIEENRALHQHLTALGVPHEYEEHPGEHNWEYWDKHIQDTLKFFSGVLGNPRLKVGRSEQFMEPFYIQFNLSEALLLSVLEGVAGEPLTHLTTSSSVSERDSDTRLVTFRYTLQNGEAGETTLFVKKCVWKGKSEAVHYRYLGAAGVPTPSLYGSVTNTHGEEVIFLEPITSTGFESQSEGEWREMLSLLARFNACPITSEYAVHLHPYEQVGLLDENMWLTGLSARLNDSQMEAGLRACGVSEQELPPLKLAASKLFAQVEAQPKGLLHQDFHPDNFGWRGEREQMVVFDLHKNSLGPRFADVVPYLALPDWSGHKAFLDAAEDGITRRDRLTRHYLEEYARFGGEAVSLETFRSETSALFWAHKVTSLWWLIERKQDAAAQEALNFLAMKAA